MQDHSKFQQQVKVIYRLLVVLFIAFGLTAGSIMYVVYNPDAMRFSKKQPISTYVQLPETESEEDYDKIENGIHLRTGLVDAEGLMEVVNNCTNCHSAQLVMQNRMTEERWISTIRWMQETQNLWDLGKNEAIIVNYLVKNYPPEKQGRRAVLSNVAWYELQD